MLDQLAGLTDLTAFALIAAVVTSDSLFPVLPGEVATLSGAVLAARGELPLLLVFAATWLGAFAGDNGTYLIGATAGRRLLRGRRGRAAARLEWTRRRLDERGPLFILVARFIPGGRNAVGLAAGSLGMRWTSFACWDLLAAAAWALYATALGYLTGSTFEGGFAVPLLVSLGLAALLGLAGELAIRRRWAAGR